MATSNFLTERALTKDQAEAAKVFYEALNGDMAAQHRFMEGISTGDIPVQVTPILNRIALNGYDAAPTTWQLWASRMTLPDFESSPYYNFAFEDEVDPDIEPSTAGTTHVPGTLARIPEYGEYPVLRFSASEQALKLAKNGVQLKFSWESLIKTRNFGMIQRAWTEFGKRAKKTEEIEAVKSLVTGSGLNTANFNSGNQNLATGVANQALSIASLEAAFQQIGNQTYKGRRITAPQRYNLLIPRALELTAESIKSVTEVRKVEGVGTDTETRTVSGNPVASKFDIIVVDGLQEVAPSFSDTSWFLLPKPGSMANDNVVELFLQGHESPEYFVKKNTDSSPENGDYIDDSYSQKVRYPVSSGFVSPEGTLYSEGVAA